MSLPGHERGAWLRRIARGLAITGVLLLVIAVRVVTASRSELAEADRLRERGEVEGSISHYRRAARWYAPGNPYSTSALDALAAIALHAEEAGDRELALAAWRSVRGAILAARSFYVPHAERLARADEHIATLMAALPPPPMDAEQTEEERRATHLALLRGAPRPSVLWGVVALVGLGTWIAAALAFLTRAVDEDDRVIGAQARVWGTVWILGFGSFLLGLALA